MRLPCIARGTMRELLKVLHKKRNRASMRRTCALLLHSHPTKITTKSSSEVTSPPPPKISYVYQQELCLCGYLFGGSCSCSINGKGLLDTSIPPHTLSHSSSSKATFGESGNSRSFRVAYSKPGHLIRGHLRSPGTGSLSPRASLNQRLGRDLSCPLPKNLGRTKKGVGSAHDTRNSLLVHLLLLAPASPVVCTSLNCS